MLSIDEDNNLLIIDPPDTFHSCTRGYVYTYQGMQRYANSPDRLSLMELNRTDCGECKITITPIIDVHSDPLYNCTFKEFIGKNGTL